MNKKTYRRTKAGLSENHLEAIFEYNIKIRNAQFLSYIPVVASGKNSLFMHYVDNNAKLNDGDLILMDAGAVSIIIIIIIIIKIIIIIIIFFFLYYIYIIFI